MKYILEPDTQCMICSHMFPLVALISTGVTICSNCAITVASQIVEQQYKDNGGPTCLEECCEPVEVQA